MKPETRLMVAIFGERSQGANDEDFPESVNGVPLREVLESLMDELAQSRPTSAPAFSKNVKPLILMRYGFTTGAAMTYQDIAKVFGVTRERVRQLDCKALRMLRHPSRSRRLKSYLEQ